MSGTGTADFFYREAQRLGYVARSAFKLLQMQKQYKLIKPGSSVLDLGCAPGAWLQVACQSLGSAKSGGSVVGIDLKVLYWSTFAEQKVKAPSVHCDARVQTVCADVMKLPRSQIRGFSPKKGFSVVLSDMCPVVSGITTRDAALSVELGMKALELAVGRASLSSQLGDNSMLIMDKQSDEAGEDDKGVLLLGGNLVIKLLESEDIQEVSRVCKPLFRKSSWLRPKATRPSSKEIYLICQERIALQDIS